MTEQQPDRRQTRSYNAAHRRDATTYKLKPPPRRRLPRKGTKRFYCPWEKCSQVFDRRSDLQHHAQTSHIDKGEVHFINKFRGGANETQRTIKPPNYEEKLIQTDPVIYLPGPISTDFERQATKLSPPLKAFETYYDECESSGYQNYDVPLSFLSPLQAPLSVPHLLEPPNVPLPLSVQDEFDFDFNFDQPVNLLHYPSSPQRLSMTALSQAAQLNPRNPPNVEISYNDNTITTGDYFSGDWEVF